MDRVSHFLINIPEPELVVSNVYQVVGSAIRLTAYNLTGQNVVQIQVFVGGGDDSHGNWQTLYRCGQAVQLTAIDNQLIEMVGGKYRAIYDGDADVKVWAETNDLNLDKNVVYNYTNPCPATGGGGGGSISVVDTNSVDLTLVGTILSADVNISADTGNIISIHADGLFASAAGGGIDGSGATGQVSFFSAATTIAGDNANFWDNTNKRLGLGTVTPVSTLHVKSTTAASLQIDPFGVAAGNTGEFRLLELAAGGTNYVGFKSADALAGNVVWVLPIADGTAGQVLSTDGAKNLSWASAGGGGTIGGSIANQQIAFGTAANTIGGSNDLKWDGTNYLQHAGANLNFAIGPGTQVPTGMGIYAVNDLGTANIPIEYRATRHVFSRDIAGVIGFMSLRSVSTAWPITVGDVMAPETDNLIDLGGTTGRWRVVYGGEWNDTVNHMKTANNRLTVQAVSAGGSEFGICPNGAPGADQAVFKLYGSDYIGDTANWRAFGIEYWGGAGGTMQGATIPANSITLAPNQNGAGSFAGNNVIHLVANSSNTLVEAIRLVAQGSPVVSFFSDKVIVRTTGAVDIFPTTADAITINPFGVAAGNTGELRFAELVAGGTNVVGFKAPDAVAADVIWVLPNADGTNGQVLTTDGTKNLSWSTPAGGGTIGGSIALNQIAVGSGANTIAGSSSLTYDGSVLSVAGGQAGSIRKTSIAGNVLVTDYQLWCDSTGGMLSMNLPLATAAPNQVFILLDYTGAGGTFNIIFNTAGGDTFRGAFTTALIKDAFGCLVVTNDGVNIWNVVSYYNGL